MDKEHKTAYSAMTPFKKRRRSRNVEDMAETMIKAALSYV